MTEPPRTGDRVVVKDGFFGGLPLEVTRVNVLGHRTFVTVEVPIDHDGQGRVTETMTVTLTVDDLEAA